MKRTLSTLASASVLLLAGSACLTADPRPVICPPVDEPAGAPALLGGDCDPLSPEQCGFPFPSNVYLVDDPKTPTGKRVAFGKTTLPRATGFTDHIDPALFSDHDGFSPGQPALAHIPGATVTGLPTQDTIADSIKPDSATILMEAETGELVPHFADRDESVFGDEDSERTLEIRPVVRLKDATRYIVAIRRVVDVDGKVIAPSPAFLALRDDKSSCERSVGLRRVLYKDIFARLAKAGIKKDDLQLAWDYSTSSRESTTRRLLHMRDEALNKVSADGPEYTITKVEDNPNPHIWKRFTGMMKVPLYLDKVEPGGRFFKLDAEGLPMLNGTGEFEFVVHIPNAATKGTPGALLQNGHGLLGSKFEGQDGYLAAIADTGNYVAFGVDLVGIAQGDRPVITDSIVTNIDGFRGTIEREHQGLLNSLLVMRMMMGRFAKEPQTFFNGIPTIDHTRGRFYRGDSQGGILGTTYMAISTDVTRGLLGEPGMPYSLLLNRSVDFGFYFALVKSAYQTSRNVQLLIGLLQMTWDRTEPNGYAPYLAKDMLPGTPKHDVLLHVAIGDFQVTPLGAHIIARAIDAKNLAPVNRTIWGVPDDPGPFMGSGLVEFGFGLPDAPKTNIPPTGGEDDDPHDKVRVLDAATAQEHEFFQTGTIKAYCKGSCDPE